VLFIQRKRKTRESEPGFSKTVKILNKIDFDPFFFVKK